MSYSNSLQYRSLQRVNAMIDREDQEKKEICDFLVRVYRSLYVEPPLTKRDLLINPNEFVPRVLVLFLYSLLVFFLT